MTIPNPTLDAIARPGGGLAMVAMDQRESLRHMFDPAGRGRPDDAVLIDFKREVATALADLASGFLIDRDFGGCSCCATACCQTATASSSPPTHSTQQPGGPVEDTGLDAALVDASDPGVAALKLLIIWRRDAQREARVELARQFIAEAAERGVLSVLEPVVRATRAELADGSWDLDDAIREAARELSPLRPSLYKVQVPLAGAGDAAEQRPRASGSPPTSAARGSCSRRAWSATGSPAVEAACRAGASGFLAGRALWSDVVGAEDVPATCASGPAPARAPRRGRRRARPPVDGGVMSPDDACRSTKPSSWRTPSPTPRRPRVRLGLLHTVPALAARSSDLLRERRRADAVHVVDAGLLAAAIDHGVDDAVRAEVLRHVRHLADDGADAILVTCSSIGEAVERSRRPRRAGAARRRPHGGPSGGGRAGPRRPGPARRRARDPARDPRPDGAAARVPGRRGSAPVEVESSVVEGAAAARSAGDQATHDRLVAAAITAAAERADVVVLAQASMAACCPGAGRGAGAHLPETRWRASPRGRACRRRGRSVVTPAVSLLAYADRLGGSLAGTAELLEGPLSAFRGVHLLPFFSPSTATTPASTLSTTRASTRGSVRGPMSGASPRSAR